MFKKVAQNLVVFLMVLFFQAGIVLAEENIPKTGDPAWDTLSQVKKDWMLTLYGIVVAAQFEPCARIVS